MADELSLSPNSKDWSRAKSPATPPPYFKVIGNLLRRRKTNPATNIKLVNA